MNVTLNEIKFAFEKRTMDALDGVPVLYVVSWQDRDDNSPETNFFQTNAFGKVYREEKGKNGLRRRVGVYKVMLSVPAETNPEDATNISTFIEGLYSGQYIYTESGHRITCEEPYTTDLGRDEETKRYIMYIDVPWYVFFND